MRTSAGTPDDHDPYLSSHRIRSNVVSSSNIKASAVSEGTLTANAVDYGTLAADAITVNEDRKGDQ